MSISIAFGPGTCDLRERSRSVAGETAGPMKCERKIELNRLRSVIKESAAVNKRPNNRMGTLFKRLRGKSAVRVLNFVPRSTSDI